MAAAAGDYLSVHLSTIVSTLGISESLAGVTIFAFGNGSSDLFSTLAAMNANSGSLAIIELFGAAAFITTIVLGLVAIARPFSVNPSVFIGEVVWFILMTSCLVAFLADGHLQLGECLGIIGLYAAFVTYALLRPHSPRQESDPVNTIALPTDSVTPDATSDSTNLEIGQEPDEATRLLASDNNVADITPEQARRSDEAQADSSSDSMTISPGFGVAILKIFPGIHTWSKQSTGEKALTLFSIPLLLPIGLTTPIDLEKLNHASRDTDTSIASEHITIEQDISPLSATIDLSMTKTRNHSTARRNTLPPRAWVMFIQFMLGPQLLAAVFVSQTSIVEATSHNFELAALWSLPLSASLVAFYITAHLIPNPRLATTNHFFNAAYAFTISLTWIYLAATSVVTLLKTIGFILNISEAILGATVFAIGNSSNDLIADPAVAKRGYPVLAASACFGGPMMNMLLGIGIGGLVQVLKADSHGVSSFEVSTGLFVSAASLLTGLFATLIYAFYNSWRLDRNLALILFGIWSVFTTTNIALAMVEPSPSLLSN